MPNNPQPPRKDLAEIKGTMKMHSALLAYLSAAITALLLRAFFS